MAALSALDANDNDRRNYTERVLLAYLEYSSRASVPGPAYDAMQALLLALSDADNGVTNPLTKPAARSKSGNPGILANQYRRSVLFSCVEYLNGTGIKGEKAIDRLMQSMGLDTERRGQVKSDLDDARRDSHQWTIRPAGIRKITSDDEINRAAAHLRGLYQAQPRRGAGSK